MKYQKDKEYTDNFDDFYGTPGWYTFRIGHHVENHPTEGTGYKEREVEVYGSTSERALQELYCLDKSQIGAFHDQEFEIISWRISDESA